MAKIQRKDRERRPIGKRPGELTVAKIYDSNKKELKPKITKKQFRAVANQFFENLMYGLFSTGCTYKLPNRLGTLTVAKRKTNNGHKMVDWQKSKALGKRVYHTNKHTDSWYARTIWNKSAPQCTYRYRSFLRFKAARSYRSKLALAIREEDALLNFYELIPKT